MGKNRVWDTKHTKKHRDHKAVYLAQPKAIFRFSRSIHLIPINFNVRLLKEGIRRFIL